MSYNTGWNNFVQNGLAYDGTNTKYKFKKMSKKFGIYYIDYLKAAYQAKHNLTDKEFSELNGDVPQAFIDKHLRVKHEL